MTLIDLKFSPEMEQLILDGWKSCTTRDEKKGNVGDIFKVQNRLYRILHIDKRVHPLQCIDVFELEGFESPRVYQKTIEQIYPALISRKCARPAYIYHFAFLSLIEPIGIQDWAKEAIQTEIESIKANNTDKHGMR